MSAARLRVARAFGPPVEGVALLSEEGFSPRYDLDRWSGVITKAGHRLEGQNIKDKVCFFPTAKGGSPRAGRSTTCNARKSRPKPSSSASPTR